MTLIFFRKRTNALCPIRLRFFSAFKRIAVRLRSQTDRQSLNIQGLGTDWRKVTSKRSYCVVLSDDKQSRLLSRISAWVRLQVDRMKGGIGPKKYVCRGNTSRDVRNRRGASLCKRGCHRIRAFITESFYRLIRSIVAVSLLTLSVGSAPASAQIAPFDDFSRAPAYYFNEAKAGSAEAQFLLALALEELGAVSEARWGTAESWIAKAAGDNLPEAQLRYSQIKLAAGDIVTAKRLLTDAAKFGLPEAQFNLGALAAQSGKDTDARRWYWQAARQGFRPAQFNLALSLISLGGEAALTDALSWLILAAGNGAPNAEVARDKVKAALGANAIQTAKKRAAARR